MMRPAMKLLPALLVMVPLGGCISLSPAPPALLLTLTAAAPIAPGQASNSSDAKTITIEVPAVPASLATTRVPVQTSPTSIAYIKDAQWAESPARLFARLMSDTIAVKTGRVVLTPAQSRSDPGARLAGELRNFGVDGATGEAVVTFDAALVRGESKIYEKKRFEAREPAGTIAAGTAADAINRAANRVASDVADWIGR